MIKTNLNKIKIMKNNKLKLNSISRLELDINAAFYEDQKIREPSEIINKSLISIRSESFKGDVILTKNLINSVELIINGENNYYLYLYIFLYLL